MGLDTYTLSLPIKRPFSWRTLWILVVLWFLANLAAIPLLRATNAPIEPVWLWGVYTACAMFAHFLIDAVTSAVVVPAYLSGNLLLQITVLIGLILGCVWSLRLLVQTGSRSESRNGSVL